MRRPVIAVVGLDREARLVHTAVVLALPGGGDAQTLRMRLQGMVARGPVGAVVSVGLGGALSPRLRVGDWVLGERVVAASDGGAWMCSPQITTQLCDGMAGVARYGRVFTGAIAASDTMLVDAAAKAALHAATGALAVDMESHVAAEFAAEHGLPFAVLRVISDGADRALPRAAQVGMKPDGGMDVLAVLRDLARDPRQLPALIRTGREAEVAFAKLALLGRHDLLGRLGVGDPDLGQLALDVV